MTKRKYFSVIIMTLFLWPLTGSAELLSNLVYGVVDLG
jgi:hypothetical protein